jgi:hypothetical protein
MDYAQEVAKANHRHWRTMAAYWLGAAARERAAFARSSAKASVGMVYARQEHANCLSLASHARSRAEALIEAGYA